jgi:dolichyl-phosphate-mannose--protein O-mannosyl transferase
VEQILTFGTLDPFTIHWMSEMERKGIDWSGSMESRFIGFVAGMILYKPVYMFQKWFSMGFLTVIAKPA